MLGPAALALVVTALAAPAAERYDLSWSAPASCPDEARVRAELDGRLAQSPPSEEAAVTADARVRRKRSGEYELTLTFGSDGELGRRTITDLSCDELAAAAVIIVAIAVDPAVLERAPPSPSPGPSPSPVPSPSPSPSPSPVPNPEPRGPSSETRVPSPSPVPGPSPSPVPNPEPRRPGSEPREPSPSPVGVDCSDGRTPEPGARGRKSGARSPDPDSGSDPDSDSKLWGGVGLFGGPAVGVLPRVVADLGLVGSLGGRRWRVELGVSYLTPARAVSATNPGVGGRFQLWSIGGRACGLPPTGPVELQLCGGAHVGAIHAEGTGMLVARRPIALHAALDFGAGLGWRPAALRGRLGFFVRGSVRPALARARFGTDESGLVHHTPAVGGQVGAFIEVRFPVTDCDGGGL